MIKLNTIIFQNKNIDIPNPIRETRVLELVFTMIPRLRFWALGFCEMPHYNLDRISSALLTFFEYTQTTERGTSKVDIYIYIRQLVIQGCKWGGGKTNFKIK